MIAVIMLLLQFGGMPSCLPPCELIVITTLPAQYECECPPEWKSIGDDPATLIDPGMTPWLWKGGRETLEIDPDWTASPEWEVRLLGEWLCVRQPRREEK